MQVYENVEKYFTKNVIEITKKIIENNGGNEILFGCSILKEGKYEQKSFISNKNKNMNEENNVHCIDIDNIEKIFNKNEELIENNSNNKNECNYRINKVELLFRGNIDSVIVDEDVIQKFDLIVHNHPSGNLYPSENDQFFANFCRENSVGFGIINNDVTNIYMVVPFVILKKIEPISEKTVTFFFSNKNKEIKNILPSFSERENQIRMVKAITATINNKENIIVEAGTGIGKSLAYLLPSILYAKKNRIKVVISTNTIALQEQLYYRDLPLVEKIIGEKVNYKILMGRGNYICKLKFELFKNSLNDNSLFDNKLKDEFYNLKDFIENSKSGLLTELNFKISSDLKKEINASSETCIRNKCKYYSKCYYYKSRKAITVSDVIIVNHYLYFSSILSLESNILPKHKILIFDEAHNLDEIIDKSLVKSIDLNQFISYIKKFYYKKEKKGYLNLLFNYFTLKDIDFNEYVKKISNFLNLIENYFKNIMLLFIEIEKKTKEFSISNNGIEILFIELLKFINDEQKKKFNLILKNLVNTIIDFENILNILNNKISEYKNTDLSNTQLFLINYFDNFIKKIHDFKEIMNKFLVTKNVPDEIWIQFKSNNIKFAYYNSNLKPDILVSILEKMDTVVFTSATITINKSFLFFKSQLFIENLIDKELILNSPYDYMKNSKIYIPDDVVEPVDKNFIKVIKKMMLDIIIKNMGSAFILTTSYHDMESIFNFLQKPLAKEGIRLLMQGHLYTKKKLIEIFKNEKNSVLIGTSTFWEGIDVPGDSLSLLIITKIPFKVPSNPLVQIKSQIIEKMNKNKFWDFMLPSAALKLKQGYGRLIRKEDDKGACFIFDKRVKTKQYGKIIINSLPEVNIMFDCFKNLKKDFKKCFLS